MDSKWLGACAMEHHLASLNLLRLKVKYHTSKLLHARRSGHDGDHLNRAVDAHTGIGYRLVFVLAQIQLGAGLLLILAHGDVTQI